MEGGVRIFHKDYGKGYYFLFFNFTRTLMIEVVYF